MVLMQSADVKPCSVNHSVIKLKLILETDVLLFLFMLMLLVFVGGGSAMKEEQNMKHQPTSMRTTVNCTSTRWWSTLTLLSVN